MKRKQPEALRLAEWIEDDMSCDGDAEIAAELRRIQQPYTLAEIKAKIASHDYSAELLLQHAMLLLEKPAPAGEYPPLPEPDATTVGLGAVWNRHSMRAYVDADRAMRAKAAPTAVAGPSDSEIDALVVSIGPTEGIRRDSRDLTMDKLRALVRRALATWGHVKVVPVNAWQQAIDHELVTAHLGVAGAATLEEARKALHELICWHIDVATDPATNGGKVLVDAACAPARKVAPQQDDQKPYAYAVYFPDQPTVELVHDLDELTDDLTNREHQITKLYTAPQAAPAAQGDAPTDAGPISRQWLTVVYRGVEAGDEVQQICTHPKVSAMSWSHAIHDRDAARSQQGGK